MEIEDKKKIEKEEEEDESEEEETESESESEVSKGTGNLLFFIKINSVIISFIKKGCIFMVNWGMTEIGPCAINKTFKPGMHINFSETVIGDTTWCETAIEERQLWVKGDICVYDDWFATGDIVEKKNDMFYFLGRI